MVDYNWTDDADEKETPQEKLDKARDEREQEQKKGK